VSIHEGGAPPAGCYTEAQVSDAIDAACMQDVTMVVNNDKRLLGFALDAARQARWATYPSEIDRARAVGEKVLRTFTGMLSPGQSDDALGRLLDQLLRHVNRGDLGYYYLQKLEE